MFVSQLSHISHLTPHELIIRHCFFFQCWHWSHSNDRVTSTECCLWGLFDRDKTVFVCICVHFCKLTWLCKCVYAIVCMCDREGSRERRGIETEVEQEQGHPFKRSPQGLCPTLLFICFMGAQPEEIEGMKDEDWAKVLKQIHMWVGDDPVSSHWKYHQKSSQLK